MSTRQLHCLLWCIIIPATIQTALGEWHFDILSTSKGVTYTNATIDRIEGADAVLFYPGGIIRLPISDIDLPDSKLKDMGLPSHMEMDNKRSQAEAALETQRRNEALLRQQAEKLREEEQRRLAAGTIRGEETDTIEQVNLFPDRYIGKKLIFTECEVGCELDELELPNCYG